MSSLLSLFLSLLAVNAAAAAAVELNGLFHPTKISHETLLRLHSKGNDNNNDAAAASSSLIIQALSQTGMISITGIPSFDPDKDETLRWMHACALESQATKEQTFADGTRRRTLATHTLPNDEVDNKHKIAHEVPHSVSCDQFDASSQAFRARVADVTQVFAEVLSGLLDTEIPILQKKTSYDKNQHAMEESSAAYDTLADVVKNGEHLEHFHSYQKMMTSEEITKETIEMHVDQGLFLVFTPGRLADASPSSLFDDRKTTLTDGFYIQLADGARAMVNFDPEDDLVILLGDGVNQYLNRKIQPTMRAAPHALLMAPMTESSKPEAAARVWYGRMVLPPANAIHPDYQDVTFGELREKLIAASTSSLQNDEEKENHLSIGCSSTMQARQLQNASTCAQDTLYCWHQCANLTQYNVSSQICSSRKLSLICADPTTGQLWDGIAHGDYVPSCGASSSSSGGSSSSNGGSSSSSGGSSSSSGGSSSSSGGSSSSSGGSSSRGYPTTSGSNSSSGGNPSGGPSASKTSGAAVSWVGTKFALWIGTVSGVAYWMTCFAW